MLAAYDAGFCPLPVRQDGSKVPGGRSWQQYQTQRPHRDQVERWAAQVAGYGVVCGAVSGGFEILEFEGRAIEQGVYSEWVQRANEQGLGPVVSALQEGYQVESPSGGIHLGYRTEVPAPNTKLASRADAVLIETRGAGGWVVCAPSGGGTHPTGKPYVWRAGSWPQVPAITVDQRNLLFALARTFNDEPLLVQAGERPGDLYNADPRAFDRTLELLLAHGWTEHSRHGDTIYLTRPGKDRDKSASLGAPETDGGFYVFSTSVSEFEVGKRYSPFQVLAILEYGGDFREAARQLSTVYGSHNAVSPSATDAPQATEGPGTAPEATEGHGAHTWGLQDIETLLAGDLEGEPPSILYVKPEQALFYSGKLNAIAGEPESGKSWLAQLACAEVLRNGGTVTYIDLETTGPEVTGRVKKAGATLEQLRAGWGYVRPQERPSEAALREILARAAESDLVVVDGMTDLFTLFGYTYTDNQEISKLMRELLHPLADQGPAVVTIDHVVKSRDERGRWAIGGQHKLAAVTGVSLNLETIHPMGRGLSGMSRIWLAKDKIGYVSQHVVVQGRNRLAGQLHVEGLDNTFNIRITPAAEVKARRDELLLQKISDFAQAHPGSTIKQLLSGVSAPEHEVQHGLVEAQAEGWLQVRSDGRYDRVYLVRPVDEAGGQLLDFPTLSSEDT